ncbi:hypothetical protein B6N42_03575 [Cutibacterium avidum]|nr:hypothetical protein B6N40_10475 [Cutibacterium avidum]PGX65960.1 hypothetical protein B6N41_02790 [Cutibacterium avidum]PGX66331.1 hypothetical protein B6N42_03575 [Cutibacterium avidum]
MVLLLVLTQEVTFGALSDFLQSGCRRYSSCVHLDAVVATFSNPSVVPVPRTATAAPGDHSKRMCRDEPSRQDHCPGCY